MSVAFFKKVSLREAYKYLATFYILMRESMKMGENILHSYCSCSSGNKSCRPTKLKTITA